MRWLYLLFFARRAKWVLEMIDDGGNRNRFVLRIWNPDEKDIAFSREQVREMVLQGWTIIHEPRLPVKEDS